MPSCSGPGDKPSTADASPTTSTLNLQDGYDDEEYKFVALPIRDKQAPPQIQQSLRRSTRTRHPPNRYGDFVSFPDSLSDSDGD